MTERLVRADQSLPFWKPTWLRELDDEKRLFCLPDGRVDACGPLRRLHHAGRGFLVLHTEFEIPTQNATTMVA